jgi:hypothetical protein
VTPGTLLQVTEDAGHIRHVQSVSFFVPFWFSFIWDLIMLVITNVILSSLIFHLDTC